MARAPDRWPVMRAALAEAGRQTLVRWRSLTRFPTGARGPDRLLFAPQDLRGADPAIADDMAAGLYVFGDRALTLPGASPFSVEPPSPAWAAELYGFGWLRHLRAADTERARSLARILVAEALGPRRRDLDAERARFPAVVARRLTSFVAHSPLVLPGADHVLYRRYLRRIGRDAGSLARAMRDAPVPADRLASAIGLCFAGLSSAGLERRLRRATAGLAAELDAQILAEGGHLGRNPATLLDLLLDLLPLRLLYVTRGVAPPVALEGAIDRMMPMLRLLRHGDGDLALFNGMGPTPVGELATVLAQDKLRGTAARNASASGYDRLEAGRTLVIAETGAAPPLPASREAHAGCLSFEMSSGLHRIVVNRGSPGHPGPWRDAARLTDAHSTLVLAGTSSGRPLRPDGLREAGWAASYLAGKFGLILVGGPRLVGVERRLTGEGDVVLEAHHDGYEQAFGAIHTRRLRLAPDGGELEGEDALQFSSEAGEDARSAVLRFHLHPSVQASREEGSSGILLTLPDGERWRFGVERGVPRLEPSLFHAVTEGRRATAQIVVDLDRGPGERRVSRRWLFLRA